MAEYLLVYTEGILAPIRRPQVVRSYSSLHGARIAMRAANRRAGFIRVCRQWNRGLEEEWCQCMETSEYRAGLYAITTREDLDRHYPITIE